MVGPRPLLTAILLLSSLCPCYAQLSPLSFRPVAWRGSAALDRIVMISASPDLLHIYDPSTTADTTVALPKTPLSLGLSPDGTHAAVGHDGILTWIDLNSDSILRTFTISGQANNLILGDTYVWFFLQGNGYTGGLNGINLSTGAAAGTSLNYYYATNGVLDSTQTSLYLSQDGSSPNDMQKVIVASGQSGGSTSWPYHGDYPDCGPYYLSLDGARIYTSCGTVVHSSSDTTLDMYYLQTLPAPSIAGLSESAALKQVAVIPAVASYSASPNDDTQVQLFNTTYLAPAGNLALPPFVLPAGSFAAHGKGVYFSQDNTRLFVLVQADSTSNLSNPFAVETIELANPAPCAVQLPQSTAAVGFSGGVGSFAITATADCLYTAASSALWIEVTAGSLASGNGTVSWIVRPNTAAQPRTGSITINGAAFTIQQSAAPAAAQAFVNLSVNVVDAAYSAALDRVIVVSTLPDELHLYDPVTMTDSAIPLIMPPFSVSVAPDGLHAAVGHDGWISYIDLSAQKVLQLFPIVTDVHHILAAANGYIYAFPQRDWSDIYSLQIATGTVTATNAIYEGRIPRLEPNGNYFYLAGDQWFSKWDISNGVAVSIQDSPGTSYVGNNFWLSQDGAQLIAGTGKVYATSDVPAQDMQYTGSYPNINNLAWAANATLLHSTAVIPASPADTDALLFGDAYLTSSGTLPLHPFSNAGADFDGHGLFAFWNSTATALSVIERADPTSQLTSTDAVYSVSLTSACAAAPFGALPTVPAPGGFGGAFLSAAADCLWSATSDSSWLTITAGNIGAGASAISWSATANPGAASRSANISVGGHSYPITQLGTSAKALTISPSALTFTAPWSGTAAIVSQSFSVKSGSQPFVVAAYPAWVSVKELTPTSYSVSVVPTGLAVGNNIGVVTVTAADGQVAQVMVTFAVTPNLTVSPASLSFQYELGAPFPSATLTIADGSTSGTAFNVYAYGGVTVTPSSGTLPATLKVTAAMASIGSYAPGIEINTGSQSAVLSVNLLVTGPPISVNAVTSAGDFTTGPVSPGEIVVIWGSGIGPAALAVFALGPDGGVPDVVGGTTVTFNNYPAPVIYSSVNSVCAIVPYEIAGQTSAAVVVSYNGSFSSAFTQTVAPTAPHFFSTTYMPNGPVATLNSDYSINSAANPAPAGSVVVLYATGEGVTSPPGVDGSLVGSNLPQPLANVTATVGGQPADVLYAGGSPGSVEGLVQINVRIPKGTPPGPVPVSVQIGASTTPPGGTISVN